MSAHKITRYVNKQVSDICVLKSYETNIDMPEGIFDLPEEIQEIIQKKDEGPKMYESIPPVSVDIKSWDSSAFEIDLSPAKWDPAEEEKYH